MPGRILVDTTPLRESRDFRLLFTGQLISMLGTQLTVVAIPYQVYAMTHSSLQVGAISLAQLIPFLAGALSAGPVGDSVDRRRIMVVDGGRAVADQRRHGRQRRRGPPVAASCSTSSARWPPDSMGFSNTARMASVPGLVERRHLTAAFAMMQIIIQVGDGRRSGALGHPARHRAAARLLARCGLVRRGLRRRRPCCRPSRRPRAAGSRPGSRPRRACATCARRQALQGVYLIDINAMVFGMPRALFPAMAGSVFGGGTITLGFLYAAPGVGALIGAVTTGWVANVRRQGWAVIVAVSVWGAAIAVFGLVDTLWVGLVLLAVAGWADVISAVLRNTMLQTSIPERFRSRMSSIQMAVVQGGPRARRHGVGRRGHADQRRVLGGLGRARLHRRRRRDRRAHAGLPPPRGR